MKSELGVVAHWQSACLTNTRPWVQAPVLERKKKWGTPEKKIKNGIEEDANSVTIFKKQ